MSSSCLSPRRSPVVIFASLLLTVASFPPGAGAAETSPASRVARVTVYRQGALVVREARVSLPPGSHRILLKELPAVADPDSVRVGGRGAPGITLGGVELRREYRETTTTPEYRALQKEIDDLNRQVALLDDRRGTIGMLREFLAGLKANAPQEPARDLATRGFAVDSWQRAFDFLSTRLNALAEEDRGLEPKRRELAEKVAVAQGKLSQLASQGGIARFTAALQVDAPRGGDLTLTVSYLANNASWTPLYDAHLDPVGAKVALAWQAQITQSTGENWKDAAVTLSTNRPTVGLDLPTLPVMSLVPRAPVTTGTQFSKELLESLPVIGRNYQNVLKVAPGVSDEDKTPTPVPVTVPVAAPSRQEVSLTFDLPGTLDIPSDGQPHKRLVASRDLDAAVEYQVVPEIAPTVYLVAKVTLPADLPLLPGRVQHFVAGDLVGASSMSARAPGEEVPLSFGPDDRFKVKRAQVRRRVDHKGKDDETDLLYVTTLENHLGRDAVVMVKERIPVSGDEKIVVSLDDNATTPGFSTDPNLPGILTWKVSVPRDGKKEIALNYRVRNPRDMAVSGLD
jgi:uncharacterized protein (TIGR02231 family)